jgi:hypothetical protein
MYPECRHILPTGLKCRSLALHGKPYCYYHARLHAFAKKPEPPLLEPLKLPILEDRGAIQLGLAQVLDALGTERITPRSAGLYLYAIKLASQQVKSSIGDVSSCPVQSTDLSPEGEELGPEVFSCPHYRMCSTCDQGETCEKYEPEEDDEEEDDEEE